ncbi:MAG: uroporphyrinogen decarboxylase [Chloroflexota bacterium]|nr:MAG: uroporphyrinogen decarboxylase [Chloroflexota bacterium]
MNHRERVQAALRGDPVDRVPVAFWNHFSSDPRTAEDLAAEAIAFQRRFDWDFVKMMPSGMYLPLAYGCEITPAAPPIGANGIARSIIATADDLRRLPPLDPNRGVLGEVARAVQLTRDALGPDVPIIQTVFSPLTIVHKMCLGDSFRDYIANAREAVVEALTSITTTSIAIGRAALDAGADGVFFATQEATLDQMTEPEFEALGATYDRPVLNGLGERAWFRLLHVCRESIMAESVADYPVEAINWDCHHNFPSLTEASGIWPFAIVGGVDRNGIVVDGPADAVEAEVRQVIATVGRRFILSAGCGLPLARREANLDAVRREIGALA